MYSREPNRSRSTHGPRSSSAIRAMEVAGCAWFAVRWAGPIRAANRGDRAHPEVRQTRFARTQPFRTKGTSGSLKAVRWGFSGRLSQ